MTTELTAFIISAGNSLAALWTSCPPWEYPLTTILELGHELNAFVTSEALFTSATWPEVHVSSTTPGGNLHLLTPLRITAFQVVSNSRLVLDSLHSQRVQAAQRPLQGLEEGRSN